MPSGSYRNKIEYGRSMYIGKQTPKQLVSQTDMVASALLKLDAFLQLRVCRLQARSNIKLFGSAPLTGATYDENVGCGLSNLF